MTSQPDIWMIGDVQGCRASLDTLLAHPEVATNPKARFWFAGDIVNRGPDSLGSLRRVMALGDRAVTVLGNHDLHLLAVAAGFGKVNRSDTIDDVLNAPDAAALIDWLRHRPLMHYEQHHLLVHAGILPQWDVGKALELAGEVQTALRGADWATHLQHMYGNKPARWRDEFSGHKRLRAIINATTRMRLCDRDGRMDFSHKGEPGAEHDLMPWFDVPGRAIQRDTIVFGHWSALGLLQRPDVICLDSGCVWGRQLTALRLHDRKMIQVQCAAYRTPSRLAG